MTGKPFSTSRPYDAAPYASLRDTEGAATGVKSAVTATSASVGDLKLEADKLNRLREALWIAFEAGAEAGLPNTLIDLTMAYTGALRLQLSLKALAARQPAPRPAQATLRPDTTKSS